MRQPRGGDQRGVADADAVVDLVLVLEAAEDRDRVLDRRLLDHHRLEPALERLVLLDVLAVLVERRRADAAQLAARERGLQEIRRVGRAFGRAGADERVQLVDEQDHAALGRRDLLEHGLQALLELAAVLRAGDQRAEIERAASACRAATRARRRARCAGRCPRRPRSCRRRPRRRAPGCSWCGATGSGSCGGSPRRGRSPDRACPGCASLREIAACSARAPRTWPRDPRSVTRWLPRTSTSASRIASLVAPALRSASPAADLPAASASRKCSVEMNSSFISSACLAGRPPRCP